ncbi:transcriptional regulator [Vibrio galatheae]|uniref:Transcriptional regulator n=1 Tax=Vibrio galatheae TaxID=579748 RepID=A0A0F4NHW8_9VIBR|nr:hypothetical protein [Vibrio galatheae]KJY82740.1 transcriptional regulator [Vibrio galatheae]
MNSAQVATSCRSTNLVSPTREVVLREVLALAKMAAAVAVPLLLLSLVWM